MRKNLFTVLAFAAVLACFPPAAFGVDQTVTVIPSGALNLTEENGQVVRLTTNFPLKAGCLMQPDGTCAIQGPDFNLTARKGSRMVFIEADKIWVMNLHDGRVYYILRADSKIKFAHGRDVYEVTNIKPPEPDGNVVGVVAVVHDKLTFTNTAGEMTVVEDRDGVRRDETYVGPFPGGISSPAGLATVAGAAGAAGAGAAIGLSSHGPTASGQ